MRRIYQIICLIVIIGYVLTQWGCGKTSHSKTNDKDEVAVVPVEVARVQSGDIAAYFTGTANLEAEEETEVVAKVGGVVKKIFVEEGDYVEAGQVLAKLDDEKLAVQLEQAKSNLNKLKNEYHRSQELSEKNLISDEEFQRAKYEYEHQKATYNLAKLELDYTSIRAPISGVVAERMIKIGNMVLMNQATFRVISLNPLIAVLHVPERQMGKLQVGHPAHLKIDALVNEEFTGRIKGISPVVDPTTGTVKVTVEVHDTSLKLKPGLFARINIIYDVRSNSILVPKDAIIAEDRESTVFVVRDSVAYRQIVETGYVNTTHIEILKGLATGDTVATTGKGSLKDSAKVEIVSSNKPEQLTDR